MTEKVSKRMLNVVEDGSGSVMAPILQSQSGKAFLSMVPGEVLLASLDALSKLINTVLLYNFFSKFLLAIANTSLIVTPLIMNIYIY